MNTSGACASAGCTHSSDASMTPRMVAATTGTMRSELSNLASLGLDRCDRRLLALFGLIQGRRRLHGLRLQALLPAAVLLLIEQGDDRPDAEDDARVVDPEDERQDQSERVAEKSNRGFTSSSRRGRG